MIKSKYIIFIATLIVLTVITAGCTSSDNTGAQTQTITTPTTSPATNTGNNGIVMNGSTVSVYYTGTLDDGTVFDKKIKGTDTPLTFKVGSGSVIKGFNDAVIGKKVGDTIKVHLTPDLAYGEYDEKMISEFDKRAFGDSDISSLQINDTVYLTTPNGIFPAKILSIGNESVMLDLNHRLAGKNLNFEITVDSIN